MKRKLIHFFSIVLFLCLLITMIPVHAAEPSAGAITEDNSSGDSDQTPAKPVPEPEPEPLILKATLYKTNYSYLKWTSNTTDATYNIYRSTKEKSGFKKIGSVSNKAGTIKFFDDSKKLPLGTTYYYKVTKVMGKNTVETSNTVGVRIRLRPAENAKASLVAGNKITLTWSKVTYATSYTIYRSTSRDGKFTKLTSTSKTTYKDTSVTTGQAYYYKIYSNLSGNANAKSSPTEILAA